MQSDKTSCFVIPCKYSKEIPIIFNCLKSIRKFHPDDEIFVVDSNSEDKSYFQEASEQYGATVLDVSNNNYLTGAIWYVFNHYKRDFYYCIHDSIELLDNLASLQEHRVSPIMYHKHWEWPKEPETGMRIVDWSKQQIKSHTNFTFRASDFYILLGAMMCCKREVLEGLKMQGFDKIVPSNKYQEECTERLWGFALGEMGYNQDIEENSILGPMRQGQGLGTDFISSIAEDDDRVVFEGVKYYKDPVGKYHLGNTDRVVLDDMPFALKRNKMYDGDKVVKYWCSVKRK